MKILEKTFVDWWKSLTPAEKDEVVIELSRECNAALATVQSWGFGYRRPKIRSRDIIVNFFTAKGIETNSKTLFP